MMHGSIFYMASNHIFIILDPSSNRKIVIFVGTSFVLSGQGRGVQMVPGGQTKRP